MISFDQLISIFQTTGLDKYVNPYWYTHLGITTGTIDIVTVVGTFKTLINIFTTKSVKFTISIDARTPKYKSKPDICNFQKSISYCQLGTTRSWKVRNEIEKIRAEVGN